MNALAPLARERERGRARARFTSFAALACLPLLAFAACKDDASPTPGSSIGTVADGSASEASTTGDGSTPSSDGGDDGSTPGGDTVISGPRDRAGKAYVARLLVGAGSREDYNVDDFEAILPTDPANDGGTTFGADFQAALTLLDGLDGVTDWPPVGPVDAGAPDAGDPDAGDAGDAGEAGAPAPNPYTHPLVVPWITADALLVDPNMPFSKTGYLDIEANGDAHTTCGGRWPGDDALDKTMSWLVKKSLTGISDGVSAPAKPLSLTFPYLAEPF